MKAAESTTTTSPLVQAKQEEQQQPFFQPERNGEALAAANDTAFFYPNGGNNGIQRKPFFGAPRIQTKLTIGQPGDKYEKEADQVADQVVQRLAQSNRSADVGSEPGTRNPKPLSIQRKPIFESEAVPEVQAKVMPLTPSTRQSLGVGGPASPFTPVQRKCEACEQDEQLQKMDEPGEEEQLQMKPIFESAAPPPDDDTVQRACAECAAEEETLQTQADGTDAPAASPSLESRLQSSKGGGSPLPEGARSQMEGAMGADFSGVRVHTDSSAVQMNQELGAQAFTHGGDVYFNAGKYDTGSTEGQRLLGHELVHTVQQSKSQPEKLQNSLEGKKRLQSPRFSGDTKLEAVLNGEILLRNWTTGEHVSKIQQAIIDDGIPLSRFGIDGKYGNETEQAIREYQRKHNLGIDGIVGPETLGHLDNKYSIDENNDDNSNDVCQVVESVQLKNEKNQCEGPDVVDVDDEKIKGLEINTDTSKGLKELGDDHIGESINKPAHIGARLQTKTKVINFAGLKFTIVYQEDDFNEVMSSGKRVYSKPIVSSKNTFNLKYNDVVYAIAKGRYEGEKDWVFISSSKGTGWVQSYYLHYAPDLPSNLYFVQSGDTLKNVVASYYGSQGINVRKWGEDVRMYVHAIAIVNKNANRQGIYFNENEADLNLFEKIILDDSGEESRKIWESAKLKYGHNIWLPDKIVIDKMKTEGVISSGSISKTIVEKVQDYFLFQAGLNIGTFEGIWEAFIDTLTGIVDLFELIGDVVNKIISGELLTYLSEMWEGMKKAISSLDETAKKIWDEFMQKPPFEKGRAIGKVVGMIVFEVLLAFFTGGVVTAIKWAGKAGKLAKVFRGISKIVDKANDIKKKVKLPDAKKQKKIKKGLGSKKQQQSIKDVESGKTKLEGYGEKKNNHTRKKNYGEMKMDQHFEGKGFERVSTNRVTDIDHTKGPHGIDGVYENSKPPPKYIVAEAKYDSSKLNPSTKDGPQMSKNWIENRLEAAVGSDLMEDILIQGYDSVLCQVAPGGKISLLKIGSSAEIVGEYILR
jgi:hypothetical protein